MRETRSSGSVEGVMGNHDSYSDYVVKRIYPTPTCNERSTFHPYRPRRRPINKARSLVSAKAWKGSLLSPFRVSGSDRAKTPRGSMKNTIFLLQASDLIAVLPWSTFECWFQPRVIVLAPGPRLLWLDHGFADRADSTISRLRRSGD